jgi:hypothetical protein
LEAYRAQARKLVDTWSGRELARAREKTPEVRLDWWWKCRLNLMRCKKAHWGLVAGDLQHPRDSPHWHNPTQMLCEFIRDARGVTTGNERCQSARPSPSAVALKTGTKLLSICWSEMRAEEALALIAATRIPRESTTGTAIERSPISNS